MRAVGEVGWLSKTPTCIGNVVLHTRAASLMCCLTRTRLDGIRRCAGIAGGMGASGRVQSQLDGPAMLPATHVAATTAIGGGHLGRKAWAQAHSLARYPPSSTLQLQRYSVGKAEMVVIRYPPGEGYQGREDVDNPLAEANYTSRESELARFRQWSFYSQTLGPSPLLPDKSHAFWDLEIIHQGRGMSDFRAGLRAAPKDDAMSRYPPGEGCHDREDVDNPLAEALSDARDANNAHKSHDFWDLEAIEQALDMSDFRAGLCSAPTEDALIRFPRPEDYHHTEDIGNPLAEVHDRTSRLRESLSSLTTDSLATQEISSGSFGSSTFGGPCSIGIAQQAFSGALLREFIRVPSQFQRQSSSTPKRLNNPASGSMSMEASIPALLNNNFQGEYRKAASSGCGPIPMNLVFRPPTTAFQRGCSRRLGDITNSQAHNVGPAQSWKEQGLVRVRQVLTSPTDHGQIHCPRQDVKEYPDADDHRDSHSGYSAHEHIYPWSFDNSQTSRGVEAAQGVFSTARYGSPRHLEQASNNGYA
ncbi:hypothetical protein B0H10DRAFT_2206155 [Mycena sp. CBHHK59/15]|nr:hypothetical protein B0H10DRAFT_2206155 [Mycena sp. CBHHK59/15]